jgi:hypothetical protein
MSNSLVKLIDATLIPAAVMAVGKFLGLIITVNIFKLPWSLQQIPNNFFSVRPAFLPEDIILASSYSDLIMYSFLAFCFTAILIQATHFHDTHIQPKLLVKLVNNNLSGLVKSSFNIYHNAAIWLIISWIAVIIIWVDVVVGKTYLWVGITSLIANALFTSILLQDVYKEIEISRKTLSNQEAF